MTLRFPLAHRMAACFSILVATTSVGCGSGSGTSRQRGGTVTAGQLVGTWKLTSLAWNGRVVTCPGTGASGLSCGEERTKVRADGTYETRGSGDGAAFRDTGTWAVQNGQATGRSLRYGEDVDGDGVVSESEMKPAEEDPGEDVRVYTAIEGDTLTATTTIQGQPLTATLRRQ